MIKFSEIPYKRPDIERLSQEFSRELEVFSKASDFGTGFKAFEAINELRNEFSTYSSIASVRNTINTADPYYDAEQTYFDENGPLFTELNTRFYKVLGDSAFKSQLTEKYGKQLFDLAQMSIRGFDPKVIAEAQEENRLGTEYTKLVASAQLEFKGKTLNLAGLDPYAQSPDRETRKEAQQAMCGFFASHSERFDKIYDDLVKVRTNTARKLGFENFVDLGYVRMLRSDYNSEMIAGFRELIRKYVVPLTVKLRERQRRRLGLDHLRVYDMVFQYPSGNATPKGSPDWIIENGKKMYSELSPETKEFFDFMVEYELMDLVNKKGKAAGGYCTHFSKFKAPFIFSNFNGTSHDIDVLTHEAGHAFQCYQSRDLGIEEYLFPTMEACEIHSMSMEFFTWPWMELFFKEDTDKYKFSHLAGALLFLPYGAAVDEFQHGIYQNPSLSPAERNALWKKTDLTYRPYMDYAGIPYFEAGGMWQRQAHIYRSPFYYIDYCLAQICALQFWSRSRSDFKSAWADYLNLCKQGGSKPFLELVKQAGLRSPFEEATVRETVAEISDWLDSIDDSKF